MRFGSIVPMGSVAFFMASSMATVSCRADEGRSPDEAPENAFNPERGGSPTERSANVLAPLDQSVSEPCAVTVAESSPDGGTSSFELVGASDLRLVEVLIRDPRGTTFLRSKLQLFETGVYTAQVEDESGRLCWTGIEVVDLSKNYRLRVDFN